MDEPHADGCVDTAGISIGASFALPISLQTPPTLSFAITRFFAFFKHILSSKAIILSRCTILLVLGVLFALPSEGSKFPIPAVKLRWINYIKMSSLTIPNTGNEDRPKDDLRQEVDTETVPTVDADVASDGSDGSEEGEVKDDHAVETKRQRSTSVEEQPPPKRTRPGQDPMILSFKKMRAPPRRLPCVVSINEGEPIGSLYLSNGGFAILLFIDPGNFGSPAVSLSFKNNGTQNGGDSARNVWDITGYFDGRWAMDHLEHSYVNPNETHLRRSDPTALAKCLTNDMGNLLYMRFNSWPHTMGFFRKHEFSDMSTGVGNSLKTIFKRQESYVVELWFIAPFEASDFRRNCLRYFSVGIANRDPPIGRWADRDGDLFDDTPPSARPPGLRCNEFDTDRRKKKHQKRSKKRSVPQSTQPTGLLCTTASQAPRTSAAQDTVADSGSTKSQLEDSTSGLQLVSATQQSDNPTRTGLRDAKMPDRSPSPPTATHATPETPAMPTLGTGVPLRRDQDEPTSASRDPFLSRPTVPSLRPISVARPRTSVIPAVLLAPPIEPSESSDSSGSESD